MQFWSLQGIWDYEKARELQLKLVELRIHDQIPDTLLFLEHAPVITRGRGLQYTGESRPKQMPLVQPLPSGMAYAETERGGDLTYHGPGQLVIYPIVKLDGQGLAPQRDLGGFLRGFEQLVIDELMARGLPARAREKATGVWLNEKKVASMGVAVRNWVTFHGMAINIENDLKPFHLISPCGFSAEIMTRVKDWPEALQQTDWREDWENALALRFWQRLGQSGLPEILKKSLGFELPPAEAAK